MNKNITNRNIIYLSLPLTVLIIINSCYGLFHAGTYARETFNWYVQAIGQDIVDLFLIVPLLLLISIRAAKLNTRALIFLGGTNIFIIYTYVIYCFALHFNGLFLVYCSILGLSFYSLIYILVMLFREHTSVVFPAKMPVKTIAVFLIVLACLFYMTWLKEIIPAIAGNKIPASVAEGGVPTNPVHVLDLSILLPGFIITAVLLLKKKTAGLILTPVMLIFCILMTISISVLVIVMRMNGQQSDFSITILFDIIALISSVMLILFFKNNKSVN